MIHVQIFSQTIDITSTPQTALLMLLIRTAEFWNPADILHPSQKIAFPLHNGRQNKALYSRSYNMVFIPK
jgi:hypothetical protein